MNFDVDRRAAFRNLSSCRTDSSYLPSSASSIEEEHGRSSRTLCVAILRTLAAIARCAALMCAGVGKGLAAEPHRRTEAEGCGLSVGRTSVGPSPRRLPLS